MSILTPDSGLLFWMILIFGIVVFILVKYGFPVILKMVDERKSYIEESLLMAEKARTELENVKSEGEKIIDDARKEHMRILDDAQVIKNNLIEDAKSKAETEAAKIIENARLRINSEKEDAIREIRHQVANFSVDIAEKVLRSQLQDKEEQVKMINRLLDEINISKS